MNIMFQYNQEKARLAGESGFISQTGAYVGKITSAKWTKAKGSYAAALELSFEDINGLKANFLSLWHTKSDGQPNPFAQQHIQAIMGLTGVQQLTAVPQGEEYICSELLNKPIGFILQKILFTKQDGSDGFKFEIVVSSHAQTGQTLKEKIEGKAAERVRKLMETLKDKDERNHQAAPTPYPTAPLTPPQRQTQQPVQPVQPVNDVEDDVPF